jgi:acyl dehydratase
MPLYVRAAAPMIPGASLLPFVPGRGKEVPDVELELAGVRAEPEAVAAYARVCGFSLRDHLPATYPHVLAFPLHMAVMADGSFPFGAVGLVHVENRIDQLRRIGLGEELTLRVRPTKLEPHSRGQTFSLVSEASIDGEKVWEGTSTMLCRQRGSGMQEARKSYSERTPNSGETAEAPPASAEWKLGGDLGRRYAAVSGDRNPIHMHSLTAKPLGFPGAIAHGMWTKARALAALESRLPGAFGVEVRFRKPILLPARVEFAQTGGEEEIDFTVRDTKRGTPHLNGRLWPLDTEDPGSAGNPKTQAGRSNSK